MRLRLARLAILATIASGCFNATPATGVRCSSSGACPAGQECDVARDVCELIGTIIDASPTDADSDAAIDAAIDAAPIDAPLLIGPPQFRSFRSVDNGLTAMTIASPAGVVVGDLLLAHVSSDSSTISEITPPAGWTNVTGINGGNAHCTLAYYRFVTDATAMYTWTFPGANGTIQLMAFRGVDPTNPIDAFAANMTLAPALPTAPSITTTQPDTLLVVLFTLDVSAVPLDPVAGMIQAYSEALGQLTVLGAYATRPSAGATGPRTTTNADPGPSTTISVALAPD